MKRTYAGMLKYGSDLSKATFELEVYDVCKYTKEPAEKKRVIYTGVSAWDIIEGGKEAEEIERDSDVIDDNHEYLVLHFKDGSTSTFRNSYVDMFIF